MTARNFRVNNGIDCGDVSIAASTGAVTGISSIELDNTSAPSANGRLANKKYVDDQLTAKASIISGSNNVTVSGTSCTLDIAGTDQLIATAGHVRITGNLTVDGTETIVNTATLSVEDPIIILSRNNSIPTDIDAGILISRGAANNAAFYWNEGEDVFKAVRLHFIYQKIAETEKLTTSQQEVLQELQTQAWAAGGNLKDEDIRRMYYRIEASILKEKVRDYIIDHVAIQ